jgi:hypothetical protein
MRSSTTAAALVLILFMPSCMPRQQAAITQGDLVRNTQELFDAVAAGDQAPWQRYFADDAK